MILLQAGAPAAGGGLFAMLPMIGAIVLIFYFLIIRPQNKRQRESKAMLAGLKKGDKVVTAGGIHGQVTAVKEQTVTVKVDDSTKVEFSKSSISSVNVEKSAKPDAKDS